MNFTHFISLLLVRATTTLGKHRPARGEGIALSIGSQQLHFESVADFGFAVTARTGITPARIQDWQLHPVEQLDEEVAGISALEQRLRSLRDRCERREVEPATALGELGVAVFSKDHDWREIFAHLLERPPAPAIYLRAAVDAYLAYLAARREAASMVLDSRRPGTDDQLQSTLMFSAEQTTLHLPRDELHRLPPGEAVSITLAQGATISLKLARHAFALSHQRGWSLVAGNGKSYALHEGVNSVGRGRDNDVPLDADFRNVSRKHLLAQPLAGDVIVLTDVSAHGTYVPPTALAS